MIDGRALVESGFAPKIGPPLAHCESAMSDFTQRFLFDDTDVRGELTSLEQSYVHVLAKHTYPAPVAQLLGELLAAATLLVGTLKFDGLLVLQASSSGAVPLLMVECSSEREVRWLNELIAAEQSTAKALRKEGEPDHG